MQATLVLRTVSLDVSQQCLRVPSRLMCAYRRPVAQSTHTTPRGRRSRASHLLQRRRTALSSSSLSLCPRLLARGLCVPGRGGWLVVRSGRTLGQELRRIGRAPLRTEPLVRWMVELEDVLNPV